MTEKRPGDHTTSGEAETDVFFTDTAGEVCQNDALNQASGKACVDDKVQTFATKEDDKVQTFATKEDDKVQTFATKEDDKVQTFATKEDDKVQTFATKEDDKVQTFATKEDILSANPVLKKHDHLEEKQIPASTIISSTTAFVCPWSGETAKNKHNAMEIFTDKEFWIHDWKVKPGLSSLKDKAFDAGVTDGSKGQSAESNLCAKDKKKPLAPGDKNIFWNNPLWWIESVLLRLGF